MITEKARTLFYQKIRTAFFGGKLSQGQVEGIDATLNEWNRRGFTDLRWLAYMLGTKYHETAKTMQPIEEYGKGQGRKYGKRVKMNGAPYKEPHIYYGRGDVQLTWWDNYKAMGELLGIDLLNHPELACVPEVAAKIMFEGMTTSASAKGDFTGRCLEQYFNAKKEDWIGARKIINGTDKAELIAGYSRKFYECLQ